MVTWWYFWSDYRINNSRSDKQLYSSILFIQLLNRNFIRYFFTITFRFKQNEKAACKRRSKCQQQRETGSTCSFIRGLYRDETEVTNFCFISFLFSLIYASIFSITLEFKSVTITARDVFFQGGCS